MIIRRSARSPAFNRLAGIGASTSICILCLLAAENHVAEQGTEEHNARSDAANFSVKSAQPFIDQRVLHVNARLDLPLNPRIEEALSKGARGSQRRRAKCRLQQLIDGRNIRIPRQATGYLGKL